MNPKTLLRSGIALLIAVLLITAYLSRSSHILAPDVVADAYTINSEPMGSVFIAVPFAGATRDDVRLHVAVDWNMDSEVQDSEWAVRNIDPLIHRNGINRFAVSIPQGSSLEGPLPVIVALTDAAVTVWPQEARETMRIDAPVTQHDLLSVWDIAAPGSSQDLKRGLFVDAAQAQGEEVDVQTAGNVSDLSGGPMDCFPIAATNNILSLAEQHGRRDELPQNASDMVTELKTDMKFDNGVLTQNFVPGKQAFLARYNLPITTEIIAKPTFNDIARALQEGGAVELSMSHVRSASGNPDAGHVVTVVGAAAADGQMGVFIHDPATPEGADFLSLSAPPPPNTFWRAGYAFWDGVTVIDFLYIQKWQDKEVGNVDMTVPEDKDGQGENVSVETLLIGGKHYPRFQFRVAGPDACKGDHYHADAAFVYATDLTRISDTAPGSCGFGQTSEVPVEIVNMTPDQQTKMMGVILKD